MTGGGTGGSNPPSDTLKLLSLVKWTHTTPPTKIFPLLLQEFYIMTLNSS